AAHGCACRFTSLRGVDLAGSLRNSRIHPGTRLPGPARSAIARTFRLAYTLAPLHGRPSFHRIWYERRIPPRTGTRAPIPAGQQTLRGGRRPGPPAAPLDSSAMRACLLAGRHGPRGDRKRPVERVAERLAGPLGP